MGCKTKTTKTPADEPRVGKDVEAETSKEPTGMIQYFYHSPSSTLPVRDVCNELWKGHKTEPHIEIEAENYISGCYPTNIKKFANGNDKYLFLITTCKNKELNERFGKNRTNQFIIGYITKQDSESSDGHTYIRGPTRVYSFEDSILVRDKDWFGYNFSRKELLGKSKFVDSLKTKKIIEHFERRKNILKDCISVIKELDEKNGKINKTCLILRGERACNLQNKCLRRPI